MEKQGLYSKENLKKVLLAKGYEIDARPFFVNLIGIRNIEGRQNFFDDTLVAMIYKPTGLEIYHYNVTTEPSTFYLKNPINSKGTGIVAEGFYKNCWRVGLHKGHEALVQVRPITVHRDNNHDEVYDLETPTESGIYGINCHGRFYDGKSLDTNPQINKWSAACTCFEKNQDLADMMEKCRISVRVGNGDFHYTLLNHKDFLNL